MKPAHFSATVSEHIPNVWDALIGLLIISAFALLAFVSQEMASPYVVGQRLPLHLDLIHLPYYATLSVIRMFAAMLLSLLFTFTMGTLAAKNKTAENLLLPFIDIMQSIPVLGFLSISVVFFIKLFHGNLLGPECAAIFAIFTSQAWNMALSFYQSLQSVPKDYIDCGKILGLSAWSRFWRIEVPFAIPALTWNAMISMSAGWFFVVASEAITVNKQTIMLPGIGSYIGQAIDTASLPHILYALIAMFVVILIYDQIIFRPILSYTERFKASISPSEEENPPFFLDLLLRTHLLKRVGEALHDRFSRLLHIRFHYPKLFIHRDLHISVFSQAAPYIIYSIVALSGLISCIYLYRYIQTAVSFQEIIHVFFLGSVTALKIAVLIILSSLLWIPIGVYIGLHPKLRKLCQPIAQFIAAFPANLLYPLVVLCIIRYQLNVEIWTAPLLILGTQWYILLNVIAGASAIPEELLLVSKNLNVRGLLWWKKIALPGIFPYYVTGAMAAAGGSWNASIIADIVEWGDTTLVATGLGGYIAEATSAGDFHRIALSLGMMCIYVIAFNRLLWHPLYRKAQEYENFT